MQPRIQYAETSDGVSIAFCVAGDGPPLVLTPDPAITHAQRMWEGAFPGFYQPLARSFRLVWYDSRGSGLSDRGAIDFSMDAMIRDLQAVVDRVSLETFTLCSWNIGALIAATYAATHPERVSHLILIDGALNWYHYYQERPPLAEFELALHEKDMLLYTETLARVIMPFDNVEKARQWAEHIRACVEPAAFWAACAAAPTYDVSPLAPRIAAPTLVVNSKNYPFIPVQAGQLLAARIADARFLILDHLVRDYEQCVPALIAEFAGGAIVETKAAPAATAGGPVTILFTDIEASTALTQRLGDTRAREVLREHERIVRDALKAHGGSEVKTMGDGFMASFPSAARALECAIAIQRAFAEWNASLPAHPEELRSAAEGRLEGRAEHHAPIKVRIGLNAGEPIAEDDPAGRGDLFGTAVIVAARIAAQAQGAEILASNVVRELVAGKGFLFADRGDVVLRGFDDPVRLYELRWRP